MILRQDSKPGLASPDLLPADLRPRLKLFLSADIIGSTAFKQPLFADSQSRRLNVQWPSYIQKFYDLFPAALLNSWNVLRSKLQTDGAAAVETDQKLFGGMPVYWKTIGDEIVFWKELTSEHQVWTCLAAWMNAIHEMRGHLKDTPLDIKSTVWCAGFPVRNRVMTKADDEALLTEIANSKQKDIQTNPVEARRFIVKKFYDTGRESQYRNAARSGPFTNDYFKGFVDFVGPGIDIGFRLGSFASSKKMILSVDVVYLMAVAQSHTDSRHYSAPDNQENPDDRLINKAIGRLAKTVSDDKTDAKDKRPFGGRLGVYYSGTEVLKGVIGGVKYPKFWINTECVDSLDSEKSKLNEEYVNPIPWEKLKEFCIRFYEDRKNFVLEPFIYDSKHAINGSVTGQWGGQYEGLWWDAVGQIDEFFERANRPQS